MIRWIFFFTAAFAMALPGHAFGQVPGNPGALRTVIPFTGVWDLKESHAELRVGRPGGARAFTFDAVKTGRGTFHLTMDLSHVPFPCLDVAAILEGDIRITGDDPSTREIAGEFRSSYILLNYAPFRDARVTFAVREGKFIVEPLWVGGISARGAVGLTGKHETKLNVEVVSADIEEVALIIRAVRGMSGADPLSFSGVVKGAFDLSGVWPRPYIKGRLSAYNGQVKSFDYDMIILDFEGQYPQIAVKEALITQAEGLSFRLSGALDISDWAGIPGQVRRFQKSPMVSSNDHRREWVFKRLQTSDDSRTEMKYLFMKNDRGDTEAVLGIQKSIGF